MAVSAASGGSRLTWVLAMALVYRRITANGYAPTEPATELGVDL